MAEVQGVRSRISLDGVDLGTKSMNNVMQSDEAWAKGILQADRAAIKDAGILNPGNQANIYRPQGNGNLYGALSLGLNLAGAPQESRDPTVLKAFVTWAQNLNQCESFRPRASYTPQQLLQIAADATAAACQIRDNLKELKAEAEIGPNELKYWSSVADGLSDYAVKLQALHAAVCVKQDPPITLVNLDIAPPQH